MMTDPATREEAPFQKDASTAGGYLYTTNAPWSAKMAMERQMLEVLGAADFTGRRVLDVGCGDGAATVDLYDRAAPAMIEAFDPAASAIAVARSRGGERRISFSVNSAYAIPFPDRHFDIAHLRGVLHHMDRPDAALAEAARVAARVVILEPNGLNPVLKMFEKFSPYHRAHGERSFPPSRIRGWLGAAGLTVEKDSFCCLVPYFWPERAARLLKWAEPAVEAVPGLRMIACGAYTVTASHRGG